MEHLQKRNKNLKIFIHSYWCRFISRISIVCRRQISTLVVSRLSSKYRPSWKVVDEEESWTGGAFANVTVDAVLPVRDDGTNTLAEELSEALSFETRTVNW